MSRVTIIFICLISLILANCANDRQSSSATHSTYGKHSSTDRAKSKYKALVILPTTGAQETLGQDMQRAAQMALFDLNADQLELIFINSDLHKKPLKQALSDTMLKEVDIILGPVFSSQTAELKKRVKGKNIPVISYSNNVKLANDQTYILGFDPSDQVTRVVNYAIEKDYKRFGAFLPNTPYGKLIYDALYANIHSTTAVDMDDLTDPATPYENPLIEEVREKFNMPYEDDAQAFTASPKIIDVVFYEPSIADIQKKVEIFSHYQDRKNNFIQFIKPYEFLVESKQTIDQKNQSQESLTQDEVTIEWLIEKHGVSTYQKIANYYEAHKNDETKGAVPYDTVLMADSGKQMQMIAAMMPYYNLEPDQVKFLGTGLWDDKSLGEENAIQNAWFAAPNPEKQNQFSQRFKTLYGYTPVRLTSLAYDSVALIALLTKTHDSNYPFTKPALTQAAGFYGVNGLFRLQENGVADHELPVLSVTKTGSKIVDPAKMQF